MKIKLHKQFSDTGRNLIRKCSYGEILDRRTGKQSYVKRIHGTHYPRFHLYINKEENGYLELDLHLDEKKASYEGHTAHSGQYDGPLVENEAKRIENILMALKEGNSTNKEEQPLWKKVFGIK